MQKRTGTKDGRRNGGNRGTGGERKGRDTRVVKGKTRLCREHRLGNKDDSGGRRPWNRWS
jgi:hypothetical protein